MVGGVCWFGDGVVSASPHDQIEGFAELEYLAPGTNMVE